MCNLEQRLVLPARPIRVLFFGFSYVVSVYQAKLAALSATGNIDVGLVCPSYWKFPEWRHTFHLTQSFPDLVLYPALVCLFNGRGGAYLYPPATLMEAIRDFQPDLIYMEKEVFALSAFEVAVLARLFRVPLAIFCWESTDHHLSSLRAQTRRFVLNSAQLITPGNRDAAGLLREWGYTGPIEVLPQIGVDTGLFAPAADQKPHEPFSIGYVGRLVPEKGVDLIFRAATRLIQKGKACCVRVCGGGPQEKELRDLADRLGISACVEWLGEYRYEDVPKAMALMDVVVLPSRAIPGRWKEQFGHVLVEAMAMAIPTIGSSCGAIPDVIGRHDLIFPEDDVHRLEAILSRMISDSDYYRGAGQYGLHRVQELYTNERVARRLLTLFTELLSRSGMLR